MDYRRLGKSGTKISVFSFGSWVTFGNSMDESRAGECLTYAHDQSVNFFDNAETTVGEPRSGRRWHRGF